jgi:ectoine hydroxylase-related dioxygenase (phytanoyl-CoA dioxygenase family)
MLNDAELFYKKNGYYIAKNLLANCLTAISDILLEADTIVLQQIHRLNNQSGLKPSCDKNVIHKHLKFLLNLDKESYIASLKLCANLFSVMSLLLSSEIVGTIKKFGINIPVLQSHPVLHFMAPDLKIPGGYHGIGVHQDWPSLQGSLDTMIVWIPFMDVNKNNYPVEFLPGSHLGGLYPGNIAEHLYEIDPKCYNEHDFIPSEMQFGDVLFMSSFLLHRTSPKTGNGLRIAGTIRYENASESTYISRVYPHAQKRSVNRDLIFADFPQVEDVEKVFL